MSTKKGRTLLIKIGDGAQSEQFDVLCGLTSKTLSINNNEVDVTTADCLDPGGALWTETMNGAKRLSISGTGLIKDEDAEKRLNTVAMSVDATANGQVVVPSLGTYAATFHFSQVEFSGEQEDGVKYNLTVASTGPVNFTEE